MIPALFVFAYLAIVIYIGVFAFRRKVGERPAEDYFLANRALGQSVFLLSLFGTNVRINDPNNTIGAGAGATQVNANTVDVPLASLTSIQVNTLGGNDTLTLNLANGNFIPSGGLGYAGGSQTSTPGDKLVITGGNQGAVTYSYTNAHDGQIVMSNFRTVSYTGLEPITNSGNATDVGVDSTLKLAAVADGSSLQIVNVADPTRPALLQSVPIAATQVEVAGGVAYANDGGALDAFDLGTGNLLQTLALGGSTLTGMARDGTMLYTMDSSDTLRVIDISTPTSPRIVGSLMLSGSPKDVRASGSIAYLAAYTGGMQIVDFSTPASPRLIGSLPGSFPGGFVPRDVDGVGQFAIFAEQLFLNAVPFVDVTTPSSPLFKGIIDF